ncbi:sigma E factor positive regulatory protein RseC [Shewanella sairae]|uniref:Sigma E factor positive regulatory protein RseC n=1 Tax=Shewanella sairae TaxID=190310 RepID=A0ABQ4P3E8_9GAMM|nr:SoxR reducing system RseC family protein [Shewanella sairae]MCL1128600.1 SoxR reducing system RseC family protein [Shewanella sairae]GIU41986.1 sigma E factor positive regulatory protein RseC [Shewanella sairae]
MMEEVARVVANGNSGWIVVEVELKSACNHCDSGDSCGTSAVSKAFSPKVQRFSIQTEQAFVKGERLKLGLPESVILKAAALVYMLPLIGLFIGAFIGNQLAVLTASHPDSFSIISALLGGLGFWALGKKTAKKLEEQAQPVIIKSLGKPIEVSL